ncbi:MAG: cytochrome c [Bryobacteraceae bacterium]|nr:cytochrome c [Bryobacteraceae bacterium]
MRKVILAVSILAMSASLFAQDEKEYQAWMKTTGATVGSLRKNLEAKNSEASAADATKLQEVFTQVHDFWMKKKVENAAKFSTDAQSGFKEVGQLATASKFDEASASLKTTMGSCAGCHGTYREKATDGSWKIKYN